MNYEAWADGDDGPDWRDDALDHGWWDPVDISQAFKDVFLERERQVNLEGFSAERDDLYQRFELAKAGATYATHATLLDRTRSSHLKRGYAPGTWPWASAWWKPADRRRDLVKAAALLLAEIERLDRQAVQS